MNQEQTINASVLPLVSIILPVRNEEEFIRQTLESVMENAYPADKMEILVIDGMSSDQTREIVRELAARHAGIRLVDNPRGIIPCALNIGFREARGDMVIRVDGHCRVASDFILKSVQALQNHPEAWVAGGCIRTEGLNYVGRVVSAAMSSPVGVGNARFRLGGYEGPVDTLAFGAHHRWVVDRVGGFDETMMINEDDDFNLRITRSGGVIWMTSAITTTYYARGSLSKLFRQYYRYGFWRIRTLQKHRTAASLRQLIPLLFVGSILVLGLLGLWHGLFAGLLLAELLLYGLALGIGSIAVGRKTRWSYAWLCPIVFMILHVSYGLGSLWGIIRFIVLRGWGLARLEKMSLSR